MAFSPLIQQLFDSLQCLPGVGPRSAQRMALHLLDRDRERGRSLANVLQQSLERVGHCRYCRTFTELDVCSICADSRRERETLCIVETPADLVAIEQAGGYRGRYFVLHGRLSPIDGMGPEQLGFDELIKTVEGGIRELIIATSATVEGDATATWLALQLRDSEVNVSRIAHGIPQGGELDYLDGGTLLQAFENRRQMS